MTDVLSGLATENTLYDVEKALSEGVPVVRMDVLREALTSDEAKQVSADALRQCMIDNEDERGMAFVPWDTLAEAVQTALAGGGDV